jgi:hypothetical protein
MWSTNAWRELHRGPPTAAARLYAALVAVLLLLAATAAAAQSRQEREGIVLYWGIVPAAIVSERHALDEMHGPAPHDGGQVHHLVAALCEKASGRRIEDAVVRAQLHEAGIVDAPPKYLTAHEDQRPHELRPVVLGDQGRAVPVPGHGQADGPPGRDRVCALGGLAPCPAALN